MRNLGLNILNGTILSILTFFSISFLFVIYRISPLTIGDTYSLEIGFPFQYYEQFQLKGNDFLNSGWSFSNLLLDCLITWIVVCGLYLALKKTTKPL
jgi:hypothetical protein